MKHIRSYLSKSEYTPCYHNNDDDDDSCGGGGCGNDDNTFTSRKKIIFYLHLRNKHTYLTSDEWSDEYEYIN